jgi:tetratricopeptide (TPR) repeat protein/S1-C subfamily serine protease
MERDPIMEAKKDEVFQQIVENSKAATLCLKGEYGAGGKRSTGTGFFVEQDKIVTNVHVLAGKTKVTAITAKQLETEKAPIYHRLAKAVRNTVLQLFQGNHLQVDKETAVYTIEGVTAFDAENDLALLKVAKTGVPLPLGNSDVLTRITRYLGKKLVPLPLSNSDVLQRGEKVYAVGYSGGSEYKGMVGTILSTPNSDKPLKIKFKVPPNYSGGHSGGPVLNSKNEVIGVAVSGTVRVSSDGDEVTRTTDASTVIPLTALKALLTNAAEVEPLETWQKRPLIQAYVLKSQGDRQLAQEKPKAAIAHYDTALTLNPNFASAYFNRALAKDRHGDSEGAIADYDNVIRLNPENTEAYNNRGHVKSKLGDFEGAIADCDNAITLNPEEAAAYNHRGIEKAKLGESKAEQAEIAAAQQHYQDAIHDWTQAIKLDSEHVPAYKNRGYVKRHLGQLAASQGNTTAAQHYYQAAIDDYAYVLELNSEDAAAYNNRGIAKAHLGDTEGAIEDYDNAIRLDPQDAIAYRDRGRSKEALGQHEAAKADFQKAKELDPNIVQ